MRRFANETSVSVEKTVSEIRKCVLNYGATGFGQMEHEGRAAIMFEVQNRRVRFILSLPKVEDYRMTGTDWKAKRRDDAGTRKAWEQACRSSWRALLLVIKAKLEAVEAGITCFDDEFMAHLVLPNGSVVGDWMRPQIEEICASGRMPSMLPGLPDHGGGH